MTYTPAKVLLFKRIPYNATELDLIEKCRPFGAVDDVCIVKNKGYAFVQFKETSMAEACFDSLTQEKSYLKGSQIFVYHTGKDEVYKKEASNISPTRTLILGVTGNGQEFLDLKEIRASAEIFGLVEEVSLLPNQAGLIMVVMKEIEGAIKFKETLDGKLSFKGFKLNIAYLTNKSVKDEKIIQALSPTSSISTSAGDCSPIEENEQECSKEGDYIVESYFNNHSNHKDEVGCKTVMVRGLPKGTNPDEIYRLFGMYGNVMRVKIFYNQPENALVQFQEPEQAALAKRYLNNCPLRKHKIFVCLSKTEISFSGHEESEFYKEYFRQRGHRYRKVGSKNFKNIAEPSCVLHLSNLVPDKELSFYLDLFSQCGKVVKYIILKGESRTLLFEMETLEQAVEGLVRYHNLEHNSVYLKVSFSKYESIKLLQKI